MIRLLPYLVVGAFLTAVLGGAVWYYHDSQERLATLLVEKTRLEQAVKTQTDTLRELQRQAAEMTALVKDLNAAMAKAETSVRDLQKILDDHDLEKLALEKPRMVEDKINAATRKALRDLECASGAC